MALDPKRTISELRELQELTGDENGAQRVAWTETWERAREWLRAKVAETGAEESVDAAGNQWFAVRGGSERAVLIGGHIDSVPNGGWLDGALNVMAGVEVLRRIAGDVALPDALGEHGVELDSALDARSELEGAAAYLELHIEQGPVLEAMDLPLGVVLGTF